MKKEYVVSFNGIWYHFYIKPLIGFCVSEKQNYRFSNEKILLKNAFYDFSVASNEKGIYIVCQDNTGSIIFFMFNGTTWNSKCILESKEKKPEFKNLTLKSIGEFINLFYVVDSKEGNILVHQILNDGTALPKAVDYISGTSFSVCEHKTTDLSVFYKNSDSLYGTKKFRWSKKAFDEFTPFECGCNIENASIFIDNKDNLNVAAYASFDKFTNILYIKKECDTDELNIAAIHLCSGESDGLLLSNQDGKLTISWRENGLVMSSFCEKSKWSVPKKFLKGNSCENILYDIKNGDKSFSSYGYKQDDKIMLYNMHDILEKTPEKPDKNTKPKSSEYVKTSIYSKDLAAIRRLLASQSELITEIMKKISALERTDTYNHSIFENPEDLDRLTAENLAGDI